MEMARNTAADSGMLGAGCRGEPPPRLLVVAHDLPPPPPFPFLRTAEEAAAAAKQRLAYIKSGIESTRGVMQRDY